MGEAPISPGRLIYGGPTIAPLVNELSSGVEMFVGLDAAISHTARSQLAQGRLLIICSTNVENGACVSWTKDGLWPLKTQMLSAPTTRLDSVSHRCQ